MLITKPVRRAALIAAALSFALSHPVTAGEATPRLFAGTLPCASCPGIDMVLIVTGDSYRLYELYQDETDAGFFQKGRLKRTGTHAVLSGDGSQPRTIRFDAKGVSFVNEIATDHRLAPARVHTDAMAELIVFPDSIERRTRPDGTHVRFGGFMNFKHPLEAGQRSIRATYEVDCGAKQYTLPTIAYFKGKMGQGKLIDSVVQDRPAPLPLVQDDAVGKAAVELCAD